MIYLSKIYLDSLPQKFIAKVNMFLNEDPLRISIRNLIVQHFSGFKVIKHSSFLLQGFWADLISLDNWQLQLFVIRSWQRHTLSYKLPHVLCKVDFLYIDLGLKFVNIFTLKCTSCYRYSIFPAWIHWKMLKVFEM